MIKEDCKAFGHNVAKAVSLQEALVCLAIARTLKAKRTCRAWISTIHHFPQPPEESKPAVVGVINNTCREQNVKSDTRESCGETGMHVKLGGIGQHMPQGMKWNHLLQNGKNREEILKLIFKFVQCEDGKKQLKQLFIMTERKSTCKSSTETVACYFMNTIMKRLTCAWFFMQF